MLFSENLKPYTLKQNSLFFSSFSEARPELALKACSCGSISVLFSMHAKACRFLDALKKSEKGYALCLFGSDRLTYNFRTNLCNFDKK